MGETWYTLDSGEHSAGYNMALDEALMGWHRQGLIPPTLRFYTWQPATLSIGYFQKIKKINVDAVKRHGLGLVRRLTGGRAVFHDQELTYSMVISESHPKMLKTVVAAYRVISRGLLYGFRELGLPADFAVPDKKMNITESAVCFDEPSWYELIVDGRKAAGSAQIRKKGIILQHGSIPLEVNLDLLYDLFVYPNARVKERAKRSFVGKAVAINEIKNEPVSIDEVKQAFYTGFEKGLDIQLTPFHLNHEQEQEVQYIAEKRYDQEEWNFLR